MSSLKGKTAFISGGSRGIGWPLPVNLPKQGVNVMIASSSEDHLSAAISAIKTASSVNIEGHAADLRTLAGCEAAFDAHAKKFDVCDIFVHSAGATKGGVFSNPA